MVDCGYICGTPIMSPDAALLQRREASLVQVGDASELPTISKSTCGAAGAAAERCSTEGSSGLVLEAAASRSPVTCLPERAHRIRKSA